MGGKRGGGIKWVGREREGWDQVGEKRERGVWNKVGGKRKREGWNKVGGKREGGRIK